MKSEFEELNTPQKDGSLKSLMQLEDVLIQIVKDMKPEVEKFVNAQKRKDTRTVEHMYIENLRKNTNYNINRVTIENSNLCFFLNKSYNTGVIKHGSLRIEAPSYWA